VRFDAFELDEANARLLRSGTPVPLAPTPFGVLCALARQPGALLTTNALLDKVWGHQFVTDSVLRTAISELRTALDDDARRPRFIETVSRRGYRFCGDAEVIGAQEAVRPHPAVRWWLMWKEMMLPLSEGENIVGRNPQSAIWIDAGSVSRVHAHIVIAAGRATVEDRGSTNGTYVNGARITSRHPLVDGTRVTFGSEDAVFREWSDTAAAPTERVRSRTKRER